MANYRITEEGALITVWGCWETVGFPLVGQKRDIEHEAKEYSKS